MRGRPLRLSHQAGQVLGEVCPTALPRRIRKNLTDRVLNTQMRVTGDQVHLIQPAGFQFAEEPGPGRCGLCRGDLHAEQFPVAFGIDPAVEQYRGFDDPAAFTDFHRQRIAGHVQVRPAVH